MPGAPWSWTRRAGRRSRNGAASGTVPALPLRAEDARPLLRTDRRLSTPGLRVQGAGGQPAASGAGDSQGGSIGTDRRGPQPLRGSGPSALWRPSIAQWTDMRQTLQPIRWNPNADVGGPSTRPVSQSLGGRRSRKPSETSTSHPSAAPGPAARPWAPRFRALAGLSPARRAPG